MSLLLSSCNYPYSHLQIPPCLWADIRSPHQWTNGDSWSEREESRESMEGHGGGLYGACRQEEQLVADEH